MFLSLDGFTETTDGEMIGPEWSDDLRTHWAEVSAREGQMLLYGRTSFEYNATFHWSRISLSTPASSSFRTKQTTEEIYQARSISWPAHH
jgi:hypothetical protein